MRPLIGSKNTTSRAPFSDALLEALAELSCPAYTEELALYLRARHGSVCRTLTPTRIGRMVESSLGRYRGRAIPLLTPSLSTALTAERGEPIMKLVVRTDWSIGQRVVAATTGQVRHLLLTARLCKLAMSKRNHFADYNVLLHLAAAHARGLPNTVVRYKENDLEAWLDLSLELIRATFREDEDARERAAARLLTLPNFHPVCGVLDERLEVIGV